MMSVQSPLYCSVIGCGEPIIFVHGDSLFGNPVDHWINQLELAQEYQLIMPARHGYYLSPLPERESFDVYASAIANLLGEGAHLVGHSYIPLDCLANAPFPKLVFSSRTASSHEAVCEVLVQRLRAEHAVISEAGHFIPRTGKPYNDRLREFLRREKHS